MSGDRNTDNTNTRQPESTESALSKVSQDVNAPGTKIDKSNSDLTALNDNLQQNKILPNMEIISMQANNDQLPNTGHHSDAVKLNSNGQQFDATYNPDTHKLTYQSDATSGDSKGPATISIDMLTGQETITAPGDGNTTRTTTVAHVGDVKGTTVVTEGRTAAGEAPGRVLSTENNDGTGNVSQIKRSFVYDAAGDVSEVTSNRDGVATKVPADATDAKVDPKTGALTYTRADGVQIANNADGSQSMTTPVDANGQQTTVNSDGREVKVTTTVNGKVVSEFPHTDVDPASVKLDPNGTITMDRVVSTGTGGIDPSLEGKGAVRIAGQDYYKTGTVKIEPNGQETTVLGKDGNQNGDITVVRNHSGGDVTTFSENVNGKQVSLLGSDGKPLPGLTTDGDMLHFHSPDVQIDSATGKIKDWVFAELCG